MPRGNAIRQVRRTIRAEQRSLYTLHLAIVEEVDLESELHRVKVILKDDPEAQLDNQEKWVPVASPYAGDGYGELYPIKPGDEGIIMATKDPIVDLLDQRGFVEVKKHRQHSLQDVVFFPRIFFAADEVPTPNEPAFGAGEYDPLRYLHFHESGTFFQITSEIGEFEVVHNNGSYLRISEAEGCQLINSDGYELILYEGCYLNHPDGRQLYLGSDKVFLEFDTDHRIHIDETETTVEGDLHVTGDLIVDGAFEAGALSADTIEASEGISLTDTAATLDGGGGEVSNLAIENRTTDYAQGEVEVGTQWYNTSDSALRIMTDSGPATISTS